MESKKQNKLVTITKKKQTYIENKLVVTSGGGGVPKGWGSGRYKLLGVR